MKGMKYHADYIDLGGTLLDNYEIQQLCRNISKSSDWLGEHADCLLPSKSMFRYENFLGEIYENEARELETVLGVIPTLFRKYFGRRSTSGFSSKQSSIGDFSFENCR